MQVITGSHHSVPFIRKGIANLGVSVRSSIRKRLGANQSNDIILWSSPKKLNLTQPEDEPHFVNFTAKGNFLHGMSAIPMKSNLHNCVENCHEVPTVSRHRTPCERAREERSNLGTYNKVDKAVEV